MQDSKGALIWAVSSNMHWNEKEQTLLELSMAGSEDEWKLLFVVSG